MIYITKASDLREWHKNRVRIEKYPDPKPNDIELEKITNRISEVHKSGSFCFNVPELCEYNEIKLKKNGYKVIRWKSSSFPESKWVCISWEPTLWTMIKDFFTISAWC
jgi:hypothetical protein